MNKAKNLTKIQALEVFKQYEIERIVNNLTEIRITDTRQDSFIPYGVPEEDEYWYYFPEEPIRHIGATRVVMISKSTGKIVYDACYGE